MRPSLAGQIDMINRTFQCINRAIANLLNWMVRLIAESVERFRVWLCRTYRDFNREGRRRRTHRAAMNAWGETVIEAKFLALEALTMGEQAFLTCVQDAFRTTKRVPLHELAPGLDFAKLFSGKPYTKVRNWKIKFRLVPDVKGSARVVAILAILLVLSLILGVALIVATSGGGHASVLPTGGSHGLG